MKTKIKIISTIVSAAVLSIVTNNAYALGTQADTSINNRATISYSVSGTPQTAINSSPDGNSDPNACIATVPTNGTASGTTDCGTTFVVDKKIDFTVTGATIDNVAPKATGASTDSVFTVKNDGNSNEDFILSTTGIVATGDAFDTSACSVVSPASPVTIAQDATVTVTVQCTIPDIDVVNDGDTSLVDLLAVAVVDAETTGAEDAAAVDIVYADAAGTITDAAIGAVSGDTTRNAQHSATNTYTIATADLEVTKLSAVIWDPVNEGTNPKRIPDAVIRYTISVENSSSDAASYLTISDLVPSDLTFISSHASVPAVVDCVMSGVGIPNAVAPNPAVSCAESGGIAGSGGTVASTTFTLPAGTSTMTFYTEIK